MNKEYQLGQLRRVIEDPDTSSGLYLIDTVLDDNEIEKYIKDYCCPINPLYAAISSLNPAEIGMISSNFKFQAPLE